MIVMALPGRQACQENAFDKHRCFLGWLVSNKFGGRRSVLQLQHVVHLYMSGYLFHLI